MDSVTTITKLVTRNCFIVSLDMKDTYYSVPVRTRDRKYLCFEWNGEFFQFTCLPNVLSSAPRKFTTVLKPPLAELRGRGHISLAHLDDLYLQGQTNEQCVQNVIDTVLLLHNLGFIVQPLKSSLMPSQEIVILGFIINSVNMTVRLTEDKLGSLISSCTNLLVARVVGKLVSSFPGARYGPLYYRHLKRDINVWLSN